MRNKLIFGLALVFGLLAAFLTYFYLHSTTAKIENRANVQVVAAIQDIPINTTITLEMVEMKSFPADMVNNKEITNINEAIGKVNIVPISKGEIILTNHVIKPGEGTGQLSYVVPPGLRAMAIPVDEVSGVANMIRKGDRVDIISGITYSDGTQRTLVVLQNVQVLAVGTSLNQAAGPEGNAEPKTLTVAVDLQSSLRLKMAYLKGATSLVLRSPSDTNTVQTVPVGIDQF